MKDMTREIIIDTGNIVSVIARNFHLIDKSKIKMISMPLFHSIISNDHLKIETEGWLFDTITEYFEGKENENEDDLSDLTSFLEEVKMNRLSDGKFKELLLRIEAGRMTESLWRKICNRICREEEENDEEVRQRYTEETFKQPSASARVFSFSDRNGIIKFLTKESGGNVHENGIVSVTPSSECSVFCRAKNVVDFDDLDSRLVTNDEENSWLKYDFKNRKVRPTHYSIRSKPDRPGSAHPMNWVIEGSNSDNDEDWTVIDRRNLRK
ncbi:hypothetical protein M9Y10_015715 [Tritrichomonas musculus]|uniref:Uncharacterized protein n=1 Tax=Tritrichomonas musculus TaxID=1915356 RepID=A0ABR2L2Y7_9EUKA